MVATLFCGALENTVEVESPQKPPALESRDIAAHSAVNSHADRVQGKHRALRTEHWALSTEQPTRVQEYDGKC